MGNFFKFKSFTQSVTIPSVAWMVIWAVYVSYNVGWGNMFTLLPSEIAVSVLVGVTPMIVLSALFVFVSMMRRLEELSRVVESHGDGMNAFAAQMTEALHESTESREELREDMRTLNDLTASMSEAVEQARTSQEAVVSGLEIQQRLAERIADAIDGQTGGFDRVVDAVHGERDSVVEVARQIGNIMETQGGRMGEGLGGLSGQVGELLNHVREANIAVLADLNEHKELTSQIGNIMETQGGRMGEGLGGLSGQVGELLNHVREANTAVLADLNEHKELTSQVKHAIENQAAGMDLMLQAAGEEGVAAPSVEHVSAMAPMLGEILEQNKAAIAGQASGMETVKELLAEMLKETRESHASVDGEGSAIRGIRQILGQLLDLARENRAAAKADRESQLDLARQITAAIENQAQGLDDLASKITLPATVEGGPGPQVDADGNEITQLATLVNLFNVAMSDLSVSATRIFTVLLDSTGHSHEDVQGVIADLVDAYTTGDKNVFFRAVSRQLESHPSQVKALADACAANEDIRRDLSKILRESEEIMAMVKTREDNNLIRIVFEEGELWSLHEVLSSHFEPDGTLKA